MLMVRELAAIAIASRPDVVVLPSGVRTHPDERRRCASRFVRQRGKAGVLSIL
jgi:hypothetical protein